MRLVLRPVDTFVFRNHKSFMAGVDTSVSGFFPPRPGTVYGALRSGYIHQHSDFETFAQGTDSQLRYWMGSPDVVGEFSLKGVFWQDDEDVVLPLPLDCQVVAEDGGEQALPLALTWETESTGWGSDWQEYRLYGRVFKKSNSPAQGFVYRRDLERTLTTELSSISVYRQNKWLTKEPRVGIARDTVSRQAKEGMFYSMELLRFHSTHVTEPPAMVCYSRKAPDFSAVKYISLGGKQKPWIVEEYADSDLCSVPPGDIVKAVENTGIARLILLSPAIWSKGSRPGCWDPETDQLNIAGVSYTVLTAAVGRPVVVGGWDIARQRPKPRKFAVPAGSVLYLRVDAGTARHLVENLHMANFSDELAYEGYGLTWIGSATVSEREEM